MQGSLSTHLIIVDNPIAIFVKSGHYLMPIVRACQPVIGFEVAQNSALTVPQEFSWVMIELGGHHLGELVIFEQSKMPCY
jgi:hypothetical protein